MKESEIQKQILNVLLEHPKVSWCYVTTVGKAQARGYWITLGYPGISDIIGQLKTGQLFAIEVKNEKGKVSEQQQDFIDKVIRDNGIAGIARSVEDALNILE